MIYRHCMHRCIGAEGSLAEVQQYEPMVRVTGWVQPRPGVND